MDDRTPSSVPPPMPSIVASVLAETRLALALGRKSLALLVGRL